jgi:alpha-1,3-mannosyltransferase
MNALLFAPALGLLLLRNTGVARTAGCLAACVAVQLVAGLPFLLDHPASYFARAFEFSRVFMFKWTVNLKFVGEETFVSKPLATLLLAGHLLALLGLAGVVWTQWDGGLLAVLERIYAHACGRSSGGGSKVAAESGQTTEGPPSGRTRLRRGRSPSVSAAPGSSSSGRRTPAPATAVAAAVSGAALGAGAYDDSPAFTAYLLYACNFVGIVFARTLHYQFLTWYFHSLPFLLWGAGSGLHDGLRLLVLLLVEFAFNVGDKDGAATPTSSAAQQAAHLLLLAAIALGRVPNPRARIKGE